MSETLSDTFLRVIAIETSQRRGSLSALREQRSEEESIVGSKVLPEDQRTAQSLLPAVQELLGECGWQPGELDLVCTTTGPGSFTGLRLGVVTAKTLAYATGAKLVGVSTLAAIAAGVPPREQRLWAILDAQRQQLFAACYTNGWQDDLSRPPEIKIVGIEDWLHHLRAGDVVAGPPLKKLFDRLPDGVEAAAPQFWAPQAAVVGRLGTIAFQRGHTVDAMQLVPQYYRKSAAEEKAEANDAGNDE